MITGTVNRNNEAIIQIAVRGPRGMTTTIAALVDTGFDGSLTLPSRLVAELQLPFRRSGRAILGEGTDTSFDVYEATVLWDRSPRQVPVGALDSEPLLGRGLLVGYRLTIQVIPSGQVLIASLASPR